MNIGQSNAELDHITATGSDPYGYQEADNKEDSNNLSPSIKTNERRVTFRKRRLSLPTHHLSTPNHSLDDDSDLVDILPHELDQQCHHSHTEDSDAQEKAHSFRKRRLSLIQNHQQSTEERGDEISSPLDNGSSHSHHSHQHHHHSHPVGKRPRRASDASSYSVASTTPSTSSAAAPLRPKTMHSEELLHSTDGMAPPSPAIHSDNVLYTRVSLPPPLRLPGGMLSNRETGPEGKQNGEAVALEPKWSIRQTVRPGDEANLPFPRDIVGTYSCHGVEPVYDSSYEDFEEVDDDEDGSDDNWDEAPTNRQNRTGGTPSNRTGKADETSEERPTTAAKINQDRGGVAYPYGSNRRTALFAVYDGHGQGGELVSQFALHEIQHRLEKHPEFGKDNVKAFKDTFIAVDEALRKEPLIEPLFAGTTACVALLVDEQLTLANAGDSRAVLARRNNNNGWAAIDLTADHNPDIPKEMQRIIAAGGYVSLSPGPGLSARVWLDPMCTQIGLAMSRSLGDHAVSAVGVIAEPDVTFYDIQENDEFMIMASDGVWEFLESKDAVRIVGDNIHRGATKACQALIEAAAAKWHDEEGEYRDDITAIVVRLQELWKRKSASKRSGQ